MSFGQFIHSYDTKGKLYDGAISSESNRLATRAYVNTVVADGGGDYLQSVKDRLSAQPSDPSSGDRYLATATAGDWTADSVFEYDGSSWVETAPSEGTHVYDEDSNESLIFNGSAWVTLISNLGALKVASNLSDLDNAGTARTNLGLGSLAVLSSLNLGSSSELQGTLGIAKGGTGATTASDARTALGLGSIATQAANSVDIDGGNIDGATIATSDITVGAGKSLDVSAGTLTTSAAQKKAIVEGAGADVDFGAFEVRAQTFESDVATGTAPMVVASTTKVDNLNADKLDGQEGAYYLDFSNMVVSDDEIPIAKLAEDSMTIAGQSVALGGSITADTIAGQISADTITNAQLANESVSFGGVSLNLGQSDATPAFNLADATGLPISSGVSGLGSGIATALAADFLDEDNMASNSATAIASQQSIKAYVDTEIAAAVTASDLDFQGDSGGALSIDLDSEVLDIAGGTGIDTVGSGNTLTVAIDSTVATLSGSQTLTNKAMTSPDIDGGTIDGATIATSDITVGAGKSLVVSAGTFTTSAAQKKAIVEGAAADVDFGAFEVRAQTFESDVASGTAPMVVASDTLVANFNADKLDGQEGAYYLDFSNMVVSDDEIPIAKLAEDSMTIAGQSVALGGSITADTIAGQISADTISGNQINGGTIGAITISKLEGAMDCDSKAMTNVNIDGGAIDGTPIGANSRSTAGFSTLSVTGESTFSDKASFSSVIEIESSSGVGQIMPAGQYTDADLGGNAGSTGTIFSSAYSSISAFTDSGFSSAASVGDSVLYVQIAFPSSPSASHTTWSALVLFGSQYSISSVSDQGSNVYRVTLSSAFTMPSTLTPNIAYASTELRYWRDLLVDRAVRMKTLGAASAPSSLGTGDSAMYVKQDSGSVDELFFLDPAGNNIQLTDGGHVLATHIDMDAKVTLAANADLTALPTDAGALKNAYVFDLSAKSGSPTLGSSSQAQALTLPAPEADDIGRVVRFCVMGSMGTDNQLTINAGTYNSGNATGAIDGLTSVVLSQNFQVLECLAIAAQDSGDSGSTTLWKVL